MSSIKKLLIGATLASAGVGAFKPFPKNTLGPLAGIGNQVPLGSKHDTVATRPKADTPGFQCDLVDPLDPSADGLYSSHEVFSNKRAIRNLIRRHQPLVKIPSVCYDDLGDFNDHRWEPFYYIPRVLEDEYPLIYKYARVEEVNRFGLVYTIEGSDSSLKPILLTAHQDVVPVENETLHEWEYPPFSGHYDESSGYLYGRGASDDKSAITALMSAMEALLSQKHYYPRRTVVFAFGFDEECSGTRGAATISKHLQHRYHKDGIAVILDEGGAGIQHIGDTIYALPAVYEKGYLDVWFDLSVVGGHSSTPTPHTSIGMMSEIVVALESTPFEPKIIEDSPIHEGLICFTKYSPDVLPPLTDSIKNGDLD
ncbi:uncharacterized protein TrAtP1_013295 [Trichoderma atroviride]|uniref:uncharacterized protein n=1 Tax=Hypocrea atroviridis TaxID=63577 RepID=UPI0033265A68|nr:hypothetical protein TrAtP1_013295 [Trichoderma atroviride]